MRCSSAKPSERTHTATRPRNLEARMIRKTLTLAALIVAGAVSMPVATQSAFAAEASARGTRNVILVHGAWADGSSWSKVIPLLLARGLRVTAVQLPLTSLKDDAATVKRALALADGPTVLVGHSYGGVIITEAGNDPKVAGLVYIAAFAPDVGQSAGSLGASAEPAPMGLEVRPDAAGFLKLTEAGVKNDFAQDLSPAEKNLLFAAQAPTAAAALGENVSTAAWKTKPS